MFRHIKKYRIKILVYQVLDDFVREKLQSIIYQYFEYGIGIEET
jgi:hypothetical protein